MIDALSHSPAYLTGRRWDVLAWNRAAALVFGDYAVVPAGERNILKLVFTTARYRRLMVHWESEARRVLARFRADYGRHAADPSFAALVAELSDSNAEFRRWWPEHSVEARREGKKEFSHPEAGRLVLEHTAFHLAENPDQKLIIYTPLPEADTCAKLRRLLGA